MTRVDCHQLYFCPFPYQQIAPAARLCRFGLVESFMRFYRLALVLRFSNEKFTFTQLMKTYKLPIECRHSVSPPRKRLKPYYKK